MQRELPSRRPGRLSRFLAMLGRGALLMGGGAGVLGMGALPSAYFPPEDGGQRPPG